jgi:hypothetical protein
MTQQDTHAQGEGGKPEKPDNGKGPKYVLDLEGVDYPWGESTITVEQVRELASWGADQQVVIVDLDTNEETVLVEGAPIELKPGHGFGRKFKFRRGAA